MSDSDLPKLPGAQVTPPLPAGPSDPDDESPTIRIPGETADDPTARWSGSATVTPGRGGRSATPDEDAYLPNDDYGPTVRERVGVWRQRRRQRSATRAATRAADRAADRAARPHPAAPSGTRALPAGPPGTRALPAGPPGTRALPAGPPGTRAQPPVPGPPGGWYGPYGPPPGYPGYGPPTSAGQRGTPPHPVGQNPAGRRPGGRPAGARPANRPPVNPYVYPPPAPPRRRRRWPWWMLFWLLAAAACCGGATLWGRPFLDEYPASIAAEADVPGLTRSSDTARQRTADKLLGALESEQWDEQSVSVLYTDQRQRGATLLATTRFVYDPEKALTERFTKLTDELKIRDSGPVDAGELGGYERCGTGTLNGRGIAVCGWADHGSLALLVTAGRSVPETADLLGTVRAAVLKRG